MESIFGRRISLKCFLVEHMARFLVFPVLISILPATQLCAESIRVGYFVIPPYIMKAEDSAGPEGALVRFMEEKIAPEMGVSVLWAEGATSLQRQLFQLEHHELDAGVILAKKTERLTYLNYPRNPFFETSPSLALLKSHPLQEIKKVEDVLGLTVGCVGSSYVSPFMRDSRIKFECVHTDDASVLVFRKLLAGRVDAHYQLGVPTLLYLAKMFDAEDKIKILRLPEKASVYTAFSREAGNHLAERYDRAFEKAGGMQTFIQYFAAYIDISKL